MANTIIKNNQGNLEKENNFSNIKITLASPDKINSLSFG